MLQWQEQIVDLLEAEIGSLRVHEVYLGHNGSVCRPVTMRTSSLTIGTNAAKRQVKRIYVAHPMRLIRTWQVVSTLFEHDTGDWINPGLTGVIITMQKFHIQ